MSKFIVLIFKELSKIKGKIIFSPALGIERATVLCNNAELVNPCKARPT